MTPYQLLLKDPRWQRKRLEVMQRDAWTCTKCGDQNSPLQVHHKYYNFDLDPWDYPMYAMTTYCELCHAKHHFFQWFYKNAIAELLKQGFMRDDIDDIMAAVKTSLSSKNHSDANQYIEDVKNLIYA
jgi:hypothetical protein